VVPIEWSEWTADAYHTAITTVNRGVRQARCRYGRVMPAASLQRHRRDWDDLGRFDPLWAVLTYPERRFGAWDLETFLRTGEDEAGHLLVRLDALGYPRQREIALDFGCGVGRVTRALAKYFASCYGVDISVEMVGAAREITALQPNCQFLVLDAPEFGRLPVTRFDLIYCNIVLQHLPSQALIERYIAEFVTSLRPGGLAVFQLPTAIPWLYRAQPGRRVYALLRNLRLQAGFLYQRLGLSPLRMSSLPERRVLEVVRAAYGRVLEVDHDQHAGPRIPSRTYYVTTRA
jgi:SAM-dependent methyltransferase